MAKRKRLTPALGLETKAPKDGWAGTQVRSGGAPIADVAGSAATAAALDELAHELEDARAQGRMIVRVDLDAVDETYLVRDRAGLDPDDLDALVASLRARGQQSPIEVVDFGQGRYGLISGWRRLTALKALHAESPGGGFDQIQCLIRTPDTSSHAYIAMVEENEIRAPLSHYERARIAAKAHEQGAFETPRKAAKALFGSVPRAKRSKIYSFLNVYEALDDVLRFPQALSEREGLAIASALGAGDGALDRLRAALMRSVSETSTQERKIIGEALRPHKEISTPLSAEVEPESDPVAAEISVLRTKAGLVLEGPGVDAALERDLRAWLLARHAM